MFSSIYTSLFGDPASHSALSKACASLLAPRGKIVAVCPAWTCGKREPVVDTGSPHPSLTPLPARVRRRQGRRRGEAD